MRGSGAGGGPTGVDGSPFYPMATGVPERKGPAMRRLTSISFAAAFLVVACANDGTLAAETLVADAAGYRSEAA